MTTVPFLKTVSRVLSARYYEPIGITSILLCTLLTEQYNETFSETAEVGSQVIRVVATDADSGSFGEVTYSILSGNEVKPAIGLSMIVNFCKNNVWLPIYSLHCHFLLNERG